jgi:hypothetical protein
VLFDVIAAEVDGLFFAKLVMPFVPETSKIDRSMSIYPVHAIIRNFVGSMTRKLSVT